MNRLRIRSIIVSFVVLALLAIVLALVVLSDAPATPTPQFVSPGRLILADYLRPNHNYTVDLYDLERNARTSLPREDYEDIGRLYLIDEEFVYASICFESTSLWFCRSGIREIISPEQVDRYDVVRQVWKENYGSPVWSPDDTRIAFTSYHQTTEGPPMYWGDSHVMAADGTNMIDLTPDQEDNGFFFTWSPDSQRIAFACHNEQYLCIANPDGSDLLRIDVPPNTAVREMSWSTDGSLIAFALLDIDYRNSELYVIHADGSGMQLLLEAGTDFHESPVWSPDSSRIAFRSGEQNNNIGEIYVIEPDGTNLINLTQSLNGTEFGATWSPDSTRIAFFSHGYPDGDGLFLYITNADGTGLREIAENLSWDFHDGGPVLFWIP